MTTPEPLLIYTRPGCHLCEQVLPMLEALGIEWREVNIEGVPDLERLYGLRIPVLRHPRSGQELEYPFDREQLKRFAASAN